MTSSGEVNFQNPYSLHLLAANSKGERYTCTTDCVRVFTCCKMRTAIVSPRISPSSLSNLQWTPSIPLSETENIQNGDCERCRGQSWTRRVPHCPLHCSFYIAVEDFRLNVLFAGGIVELKFYLISSDSIWVCIPKKTGNRLERRL